MTEPWPVPIPRNLICPFDGIKKLGNIDLIICGKQATDGDTAQVGPSLAEKLGYPHTTYVRKIEEIKKDI